MFDGNRPRPFIRPAAPNPVVAEPAAVERAGRMSDRDIVRFIDARLAACGRHDATALANALLDVRLLLRVPVVPGRSA